MDRRSVLILVAFAVVAVGYLVVRDPVGAADIARQGATVLFDSVSFVFQSLVTFVRHLFEG
ncbi:hypothetical protein [Actinopolyspora sp. BKK1]|uniref:Uncharacterized protein n=1 Tax=Actinopolyspora saharensis TaxID=995062 RepID=A0A1H1H5U8_9ACTN|nr:hypothetical protein [Actinopolyspora sp. BKK1]NHD18039.1 hypothetical protein [Actinopolyspora sp. BKK2]NHE78638.1 hypothetical protein [Actinopolyspora sp. BKK1]SDR20774.1 hypothetical protein SAMN04489718_4146 [Actinopolyspora saharensis]